MAVFAPQKSTTLISCKIWVIEKLWNFHTVDYNQKIIFLLDKTIRCNYSYSWYSPKSWYNPQQYHRTELMIGLQLDCQGSCFEGVGTKRKSLSYTPYWAPSQGCQDRIFQAKLCHTLPCKESIQLDQFVYKKVLWWQILTWSSNDEFPQFG